jgi:trimethylamine--corrinoid protein Co-methyltransferase
MLVMADELVAMSRHFTAGIPVNTDTLALDVIDRVALGGEQSIFLTENHTLDHFKEAHFHPRLLDRNWHDAWKESGGGDLYDRCNTAAKKILANHVAEPKPAGIVGEIGDILEPPRKKMAV